jgi:2-polyprenyl-3-methyl-5-hydroxy-6-metoxy-1,4-benzoquinol methylase
MKNVQLPLYIIFLIILLHIIIYFQYDSSIFFNYNTKLTLFVWLICIFIAYNTNNNLLLLLPFLLLFINEMLYIYFNIDIFDGGQRTALFYDITTLFMIDKTRNNNTNLTEGLYLKDLNDLNSVMTIEECKTLNPLQANHNKYMKFFMDLNIPKSEYSKIKLLDIGCGNGDFIKYCKSIGIEASGISISKNQVKEIVNQGFDAHLGSYRELQKQFIGKYDIITAWGCLEHITDSYPCSKSGEKKAKNMLKKIINNFKQYYKTDSEYKYFFNTTLHINKKYCDTINVYLLERAYAGWYFYDKPGERIGDLIQGFDEIYSIDMTYHYYAATKIDPKHFGVPRPLDLYSILCVIGGFFVNPHISAMLLYTLRGEWMWQFDGEIHMDDSCDDCNFEENRENRPTTLIWSLNKLK